MKQKSNVEQIQKSVGFPLLSFFYFIGVLVSTIVYFCWRRFKEE